MTNNSPTPSQHGGEERELIPLEAACKAICLACKQGKPLVRTDGGYFHDNADAISSYPHWCYAANLRNLAESHPLPAPKNDDLIEKLRKVSLDTDYSDSEALAKITILCTRAQQAKPLPAPVEEGQEIARLKKELRETQDELFEMCKLVHKYQDQLWSADKAALSSPTEEAGTEKS